MAVINTNVASLNAQRNLWGTSSALDTSLQRLSSGLRINSAKDDAAGLAISERFSTQIRGLNQAVRNANDGISLAQTGEGALGELTQNLQRVRELALQSVNATNSNSDRAAIDLEVQQRLQEIDRVAAQTQFNGRFLLDGSFGNADFQVGANVGQTIGVDLQTSMRLDSIGQVAKAESTVDLNALMEGSAASFSIDGTGVIGTDYSTIDAVPTESTALGTIGTPSASTVDGQAYVLKVDNIEILNVVQAGGNAETIDTARLQAAFDAWDAAADGYAVTGALATGDLKVSRLDGDDMTISLTTDFGTAGTHATMAAFAATHANGTTEDSSNNADLAIAIPGGTTFNVTLDTDIQSIDDLLTAITSADDYADADFTVAKDGSNLVFTAKEPGAGNITLNLDSTSVNAITDGDVAGVAGVPVVVAGDFSIQVGDADPVAVANGTYNSAQELVVAINRALAGNGQAAVNEDGTIGIVASEDITVTGAVGQTTVGLQDATVSGSLVGGDVKTVANSNELIQRIDAALKSVSDLRSVFGAVQNRFESAISNMQATSENLSASRSRIQDADFAQETANMTRAQILQQAGIAMLSQANSMPNMVLSLLR